MGPSAPCVIHRDAPWSMAPTSMGDGHGNAIGMVSTLNSQVMFMNIRLARPLLSFIYYQELTAQVLSTGHSGPQLRALIPCSTVLQCAD